MKVKSSHNVVIGGKGLNGITVHTGDDAWTLLSNDSFLSDWDALYETCQWATVFQSRSFVMTWYQTYRDQYLPIVVTGVKDGELIGLFTLSVNSSSSKSGPIMGAGQYQSYYHLWLTEASNGEPFIKAAIKKVQQQFPRYNIHLRYIPVKAPLQWIEEPYWKSHIVVQEYSRPLMDMSQPDFSKMTRGSDFRNKLNRLKRLGEVTFKRITNKEQFENILQEVTVQYNFRQGAMFNHNQFTEDPLKADFLTALFKKNLLHVSVLKVNRQFFASIIAIAECSWVHLGGVNVHTPFHARTSPGILNFILLGQHLAKEGYSFFDLTPGGDFYKERLATKHDEVLEVVISSDWTYRTKRRLRKLFYKRIAKMGKWPMGVELSIKKKIYLLKGRIHTISKKGIVSTALEGVIDSIQRPKATIYLYSTTLQDDHIAIPINKNSLIDVLYFEAEGTWMTRWEFLEDAMHRFGVGQNAYTFSEGGRMLGCVWLRQDSRVEKEQPPTPSGMTADKAWLEGFYCHPKGQDRFPAFLQATAAACNRKEERLYAIAPSNAKRLSQTLEAIGFQKVDHGL